ncbi:hypothetical protein FPOA_07096 [Fusarium poae]|uniref:Peptidase S7 domain-containing protein n=1 Tax=Fusarium poae TaxID=36050 RepID=A0A1B8AKE3_FUSPO|nr:hypothetical protein FPOA_07096 [Fusarium poae]
MESPSQSDPVITVISARYRAAWPELRPLPLKWASDPTWPFPLLQERRYEIEKTVIGIVRRLVIEYEEDGDAEVWLENQHMASQPDTCVPTICIYSSWSVDKQGLWETAVREIALELYHMCKDSDVAYDGIHIDMQSPELGQTIHYEPVTDSDLCDSWDDIRALVNQRLEAFTATRRSMVTIGLFQYGSRRGRNPITIYIAVDYSSDETGWLEVIADIKANIRHKQGWADVQVHIEHHAGTSYSFNMLPPTYDEGFRENKRFVGDYQQTVKPGDEFGAESYTHSDGSQISAGFGTLGCFVEIQRKSSPAWKRYALTSYHAVRPALPGFRLEIVGEKSRPTPPEPDSDCWNVDLKGYTPGHSANPLHFESPSRFNHNYTIWNDKDEITFMNRRLERLEAKFRTDGDRSDQESIDSLRARIQIAEDEVQKKIDFFNDGKQMLGTLFAASGYMRRVSVHQDDSVNEHKMRLDWALIDVVEHRQGPNCLPPRPAWKEKYDHSAAHPFLTFEELLEGTQSVDPDNSPVWKVGAANGPAIGTYHRNRIACAMVEDSHLRSEDHETSEYIYQPGNHYRRLTYCAKGDSGSIVFNKHGKVIGLYSTGIKIRMSLDNEEFGIVTPIEHIFQDIKDFLGDVTDIRVAID